MANTDTKLTKCEKKFYQKLSKNDLKLTKNGAEITPT